MTTEEQSRLKSVLQPTLNTYRAVSASGENNDAMPWISHHAKSKYLNLSMLRRPLTCWLLLLAILAIAQGTSRAGDPVESLTPGPIESAITKAVVSMLATSHYQHYPLDDAITLELFTRYLQALDPQRLYLMEDDIARFAAAKDQWDDYLRQGDVTPAFALYAIYLERLRERLEFVKSFCQQTLDFTLDEYFRIDRADQPWCRDKTELNEVWRLKLKNEALLRRLKHGENAIDCTALLQPYVTLLNHRESNDRISILEIFLTTLAQVYDPHTAYLAPISRDDFEIAMSLSLEGIGAALHSDPSGLRVAGIIPGGPAERDGRLRWGDRIIAVTQDGGSPVDVTLMPMRRAVNLIRGPRGTRVCLTVIPIHSNPAEPPAEITLVRDVIDLRSHEARLKTVSLPRSEPNQAAGIGENNPVPERDEEITSSQPTTPVAQSSPLMDEQKNDAASGSQSDEDTRISKNSSLTHLPDLDPGSAASSKSPHSSLSQPSDRQIGIVSLHSFYREANEPQSHSHPTKSAAHDVLREIRKAIAGNNVGLIVDLRFNGGGNLEAAIEMAGLFIPLGPIVQVRDIYGRVHIKTDVDGTVAYGGPLVVLVNRHTASASEIFAAAMQDYQRAVIVGEATTFGKGTMQSLKPLAISRDQGISRAAFDPGVLKLTSGKIYRVNGSSIQRKGVTPDIIFPSSHDHLSMGEQEMPNALFWDAITSLNVVSDWDVRTGLLTLRNRSRLRWEGQEEWHTAARQAAAMAVADKNEMVSLNLDKRQVDEHAKKQTADKLTSYRRQEADWQLQEAIAVLQDLIELEGLK